MIPEEHEVTLAKETEAGREALVVLRSIRTKLTGEQRLAKAFELTETTRQLMRAGIVAAHPDLDHATPESRRDHQQVTQNESLRVFFLIRFMRHFLAGRHGDHYDDHHRRQQSIKPYPFQLYPDPGTADRTKTCHERQTQTQLEVRKAFTEKGIHRGNILCQDRNAVGAIGHRRGNIHE